MASFVDKDSGLEFNFRLIAGEGGNPGEGQVTLLLAGPGFSLCTSQGDHADINFSPDDPPVSDPYGHDYVGNNPMSAIACGTSYGMAVEVDDCEAKIEFHGYVHSDYPLVTYMGMMTADITVRTGAEPEGKVIEAEIYTPKEKIKLKGIYSGDVDFNTCP